MISIWFQWFWLRYAHEVNCDIIFCMIPISVEHRCTKDLIFHFLERQLNRCEILCANRNSSIRYNSYKHVLPCQLNVTYTECNSIEWHFGMHGHKKSDFVSTLYIRLSENSCFAIIIRNNTSCQCYSQHKNTGFFFQFRLDSLKKDRLP